METKELEFSVFCIESVSKTWIRWRRGVSAAHRTKQNFRGVYYS